LAITFATSSAAIANDEKNYDTFKDVKCEVCVSYDYLKGQRQLVQDLEARIVDLKEKRASAQALAEQRKEDLHEARTRLDKKTKRVENLQSSRPSRGKWFGYGAAIGAGAAGVIVLIVVFAAR